MSRIGKQPVSIPEGVNVTIHGNVVTVKGLRGKLSRTVHPDVTVAVEEGNIITSVRRKSKQSSALWGTTRALLAQMVTGVTHGYTKELELHGVGYKVAMKGKDLELSVGYSHPVHVSAPDGITFSVGKDTITVEGPDAEKVGQVAADIRKVRKPEPYKGKGIRYSGEIVKRKVGKVVGGTESAV